MPRTPANEAPPFFNDGCHCARCEHRRTVEAHTRCPYCGYRRGQCDCVKAKSIAVCPNVGEHDCEWEAVNFTREDAERGRGSWEGWECGLCGKELR